MWNHCYQSQLLLNFGNVVILVVSSWNVFTDEEDVVRGLTKRKIVLGHRWLCAVKW